MSRQSGGGFEIPKDPFDPDAEEDPRYVSGAFGPGGLGNVALGTGVSRDPLGGGAGAFGGGQEPAFTMSPALRDAGWQMPQNLGVEMGSDLSGAGSGQFGERRQAMRDAASQLLRAGGSEEGMSPESIRLAREFVMEQPEEYRQLQSELRGDSTPVASQSPATGSVTPIQIRRAESYKRRDPGAYSRFEQAAQEIKQSNPSDPRPVNEIAAGLYDRQLRRERGMDRESRLARRDELSRSRAMAAISRRHGGNPAMLRRAINNWNSRNPNNRLRMEDFGASSAGQDVRTRPGEVAEVDDIRSVNPRNVAAGSILMDSTGPYRMARRPDGSVRGQAVMQDSNSGFYFPDPDRFTDQGQFDEVMSRQDRVNLRQAIMQSGNSVMAAEQRRLEDAREAAANSIPEIRDAGLKEVNELERALHYRYINEAAALKAPGPVGGRPDIEISGPTVKPEEPEEVEEAPTFSNQEVLKAFEDYFKSAGPAEQRRLSAMGMGDRMQMGFELLQPFGGGEGGAPAMSSAVVGGDRGGIRDFRFDASGLGTPPAKTDVRAWDNYTQRLEQVLYDNMDAAFESGMSQNELSTAFEVVVSELGRAGLNPQQMPPQQYAAMVARMQGIARDIGYQPTRSPAQRYPEQRQPTPRPPAKPPTRAEALEAFADYLGSLTTRGAAKDERRKLEAMSRDERTRLGFELLQPLRGQASPGQAASGQTAGGQASPQAAAVPKPPTIEPGDTAQVAQRLTENMPAVLDYVSREFRGIPELSSQGPLMDPEIVRKKGQQIRSVLREQGYPVDSIEDIITEIEDRILSSIVGGGR